MKKSKKKLVIFIDSGDTIINEATEIHDEKGIVIHAETIDGAAETLKTLYERGYTIALVADGLLKSFENVYKENGLRYCFKTWTISEVVGKRKPAPEMFEDAMKKNGLKEEDKKRIIMVGNNLERDIAGANLFGITSVLLDWSSRYNMVPRSLEQVPDYIIHNPKELLPLVEKLNGQIEDALK